MKTSELIEQLEAAKKKIAELESANLRDCFLVMQRDKAYAETMKERNEARDALQKKIEMHDDLLQRIDLLTSEVVKYKTALKDKDKEIMSLYATADAERTKLVNLCTNLKATSEGQAVAIENLELRLAEMRIDLDKARSRAAASTKSSPWNDL